MEQGLEPGQVLVVTYTEAATKELRGRIRQRIKDALDLLDGLSNSDSLLTELCCVRWAKRQHQARQQLDLALKAFDTAAIFTIHGFCLRSLQDHAFESGARFDTELVTSQQELLQEIVQDFWRIQFFGTESDLLPAALQRGYSVPSLVAFARELTGSTSNQIQPVYLQEEAETLKNTTADLFREICRLWQDQRADIISLIREHKGLSRAADQYRADQLDELFGQMDNYTDRNQPAGLFQGFEKFCSSGIRRGTKSTGTMPEHALFQLCEQLLQQTERRLTLLKGALLFYCQQQLPIRKQQQNIRLFDDLLADLYAALCRPQQGELLAGLLRRRYQAALIDEFQDTDPIQYAIFNRIYAQTDCPLFLIGDPKQAIYSFRGADIFAYLQAATEVTPERRHTLTRNWRSVPTLLDAFNLLFGITRPFLFEEVCYQPVTAGHEQPPMQIAEPDSAAPLQLMLVSEDNLSSGKANRMIPATVTREISLLLAAQSAFIDNRPVQPSDIAVIVRTNQQARDIRDALVLNGIPAVLRGDASIFASNEAEEVSTVMQSLLDPGNESLIRAALVTAALGKTGNDIDALQDDEAVWDGIVLRFREYHQLWHERGFMVMSRVLLTQEKIRERLLRYPDGERRLTNLLHCFELIHACSIETGAGMAGLTRWFCEQVANPSTGEEFELRLDTDDQAVRVLTVHVSKGLEFPIVFCPYLWNGIAGNNDIISFHQGGKLIRDYGSDEYEQHRGLANRELLAENLRLFYVAVTRARYRCYLYTGKFEARGRGNHPGSSALAYLLHSDEQLRLSTNLPHDLQQQYAALSKDLLTRQLQQLVDRSKGSIHLQQVADTELETPRYRRISPAVQLQCRTFQGEIRHDWRVTSFSSFAAGDSRIHELPDRDRTTSHQEVARLSADREQTSATGIFSFPKGAQAGTCIHALFEELDFSSCSVQKISGIVSKKLTLYGYDAGWLPILRQLVQNVLATPLPGVSGGFRLQDLKYNSWLTELEFFMPLQPITVELLNRSLKKYLGNQEPVDLATVLAALSFKPVRGMVRGFMDMVFEHGQRYYLLDWKSNHLGNSPEDYDQSAMKAEMEQNLYPLQYLLYTVALHRYLQMRLPDYSYAEHFGGVYYLFVRGMHPDHEQPYGIFYDRPDQCLIETLTETLTGTQLAEGL